MSATSPRQLNAATLSWIAPEIIRAQCELQMVMMEEGDLIDDLDANLSYQDLLRAQIKALKNKAEWEMDEQKRLSGEGQRPDRETPPSPEPGDEWRGAGA